MPGRYVMAISCIRHYRPAHKLVTAHLECRAPLHVCPPPPLRFLPTHPRLSSSLSFFKSFRLQFAISLPLYAHPASFRLLFVWTFARRPPVFLLLFPFSHPSACHRVVCIVVAKRRSLSSLINVDPLLIYRRVALKVNDALWPCERTTLEIPVAR